MTASEPATLSPGEITRNAGSNFSLSFVFLSRARRRGISAIYAYCRAVDDAVDEAPTPEDGQSRLDYWREELERAATGGVPRSATGRALGETIREFDVPRRHLDAVADGCAMDLHAEPFADLPELERYCAKVASAVGLACLPVFGVSEDEAGEYADCLGKALQLTNILRDIRVDAAIGRRYLPDDLCIAAGVETDWLGGGGPASAYADGGPVHRLVESISLAAHAHFHRAAETLPTGTSRRRLVAAEIMGAIYAKLLVAVDRRRGRIDSTERLRVSKPQKIALALRTWWRGRRP